jgi:ribose transport system substrate-binding protein
MRPVRILAALLALMMLAAACGTDETTGEPATDDQEATDQQETDDQAATDDEATDDEAAEDLVIGFSQVTLASPFYVELRDGAQANAEERGHELIFLDADGDETRQNNDVADLITRGVDVIILNPVDPEAVAPALRDAEGAGIPVITVDRPVETGAVAHIGRDNVEMGRAVGEALAEILGEDGGKVIEIQGDAGGIVMRNRRDGFHEAADAYDNIQIVEGPYAEYIRSNAVTAMQDLLEAHSDVAAVYAHNDDMAIGALQVLEDAGREDVLVSGVDGLMEALELMEEGNQFVATSLNDPRYLGAVTIEVAERVAAGESVPEFVDAGTTVVTQETVSDYVGDTLFGVYEPGVPL